MQKVAAFVEKPNAQTALRYIAEGLLWNSGNFLFPPELLLSEMARFEPAMAAAAEEAVAKAKKTGSTVFLDADAFAKAPAKSIDYAVMERTDKCWVVPAKFRWSDLGTWDALLDVGEADSAGNVTEGPVEIDHVRNSYVRSDGPLTAVIGVEEVVVVAMNDAVLVGHRDNLPRLKDVVQRMSDGKHKAATEHAVMHRPWGSYQDIDRGERFRAKRLTVNPGAKLSLQSHNRRAEHWVVVKGMAEVTLDGKIMTLHENESTYIPIGGIHRLANPGSEPLEVVEVQTGDYLEEDDIVALRRHLRPCLGVRFGAHHEWGKLREVVIGISPAEDFVVFHEESQRWLLPEGDRVQPRPQGPAPDRRRSPNGPSASNARSRRWPSWWRAKA